MDEVHSGEALNRVGASGWVFFAGRVAGAGIACSPRRQLFLQWLVVCFLCNVGLLYPSNACTLPVYTSYRVLYIDCYGDAEPEVFLS